MKSDTQLQHDVKEQLEWEQSVDLSKISVEVKDGIVTLTGTVPTYVQMKLAERETNQIYGVKGVANDIVPLRYAF